ncbi:MAG: alpha/beta fold hydrolase [Caulobacteraceae bacterium]|nr:alpha/beta fold hydrolase [Caulobacteraceae bacterium]
MRTIVALCGLVTIVSAHPSTATAQTSAAQTSAAVPWRAPATTQVVVEDRRFRNGDTELSGTLFLPVSGTPVAAVVVTHSASSPLRTAPLYDHLKMALPALGIAVFVYDRRGSGQSGAVNAGGDFAVLADDAIAAATGLRSDPRIDPQRIGSWGLSQGGWIAALAAARSPRIAFAVSVSAPVVTADVQMMFSSTNHLRANGYAQADIDQMIATRRAVDDYMRGTASREAAQTMIDAARGQPWFRYTYMGETVRDREVSGWRREIENDPLANLGSVAAPILLLFGSDDAVVPVAISIERLETIAARMPGMEVHVVAGADHAMEMSGDAGVSLDPRNDGAETPDSPEYLAILASWLTRQGLVGN